ncbi:hypothetical protein LTR17_018002 [Elasticomyces elasticus]|nr:hypothetical protein LTR17_018002 [Elasticomyces elasticus]
MLEEDGDVPYIVSKSTHSVSAGQPAAVDPSPVYIRYTSSAEPVAVGDAAELVEEATVVSWVDEVSTELEAVSDAGIVDDAELIDEAPPQVATQYASPASMLGHEETAVYHSVQPATTPDWVGAGAAAVLAHADEDAGDVDVDEVDSDKVDADEVDADEVDADEGDNEDVVSDAVDISDVTSDEIDEVVEEELDADNVDATDSLVELSGVLLDGREIVEEVFEVGSVVVEEVVLRATEAVVKVPAEVLMGTKLE